MHGRGHDIRKSVTQRATDLKQPRGHFQGCQDLHSKHNVNTINT